MAPELNVCVYCGSGPGRNSAYLKAANTLGRQLAEAGIGLVYGGGSLGLMGEVGCHDIDQTNWFFNARPIAVTGFGSLVHWTEDGRQIPDTIQATFEYPGGLRMIYDATLANSFDAEYAMFYGSDSALMLRDNKAWLFKEADSQLGGWEIYYRKEPFYKELGYTLVAGASKLQNVKKPVEEPPSPEKAAISAALKTFLRNVSELDSLVNGAGSAFKDDPDSMRLLVSGFKPRPSAGYLEGFQATMLAIKANEAILSGKRIELKKESYELS